MTKHERLSAPPVTEVICGLIFEPIPEIDPLVLGSYWESRRKEFPNHQLQPPISDEASLVLAGLPPIRTWFLSAEDEFVLQIQHDRFYLNWRARGNEYPRFSDHSDRPPGLLSRLMKEFETFSLFCRERIGRAPAPLRIELAKVDHLLQGDHWKDFNDLGVLLPWLRVFARFTTSPDPAVGFRFAEDRDGGKLTVALDTAVGRKPDESTFRLIKLETRVVRVVKEEIRSEFIKANDALNDVFFDMIPKEQRDARFKTRGKP